MSTSTRTIRTLLSAASLTLFAASSLAATISGEVTDRTTGKPSKGDTIAVIDTAKSMDEIAKVTSDAQGHFQVNAPDGGQILLHITHAGAEYFKSLQPGATTTEIDVYDSAPKIDGITGEALVLRAETDPTGKILSVAENFFVQNASAPPRTQYGANTFDFYLPKGAEIQQSLASAPNGLPTNTKVKTVDAATGHYAFTFPVRPGETRFQVDYSLPYDGKQAFSIKLSVPTGDVAVMLPKSMQFQPISAFQPISPDANAQSYDAHQPAFEQPIQFVISGTGQLPQSPQDASSGGGQGSGASASGQATAGQRPGGGLGIPDDPNAVNDPWSKYKWWILGILGLALAAGAGIMLKSAPAPVAAGAPPTPAPESFDPYPAASSAYAAPASAAPAKSAPLLQSLKDELFELETDRLAGRITAAEYAEHKAAFDVVLRRALSRIDTPASTSND